MAKKVPENVKAYRKFMRMKDGYGLLGFEISNKCSFDMSVSYADIGDDISYVVERYPDNFDVIEDTIVAICGHGFESLLECAKEDRDYYDAL